METRLMRELLQVFSLLEMYVCVFDSENRDKGSGYVQDQVLRCRLWSDLRDMVGWRA